MCLQIVWLHVRPISEYRLTMTTKAERDEQDRKRRKRSLNETRKIVHELLLNPDGWQRISDIPDDEWQAAVEADEAESA